MLEERGEQELLQRIFGGHSLLQPMKHTMLIGKWMGVGMSILGLEISPKWIQVLAPR